jgi:hypothetical protein
VFAVSGEASRQIAYAPVKRMKNPGAIRVTIVLGCVLGSAHDVVEPATVHHSRKRPQPAKAVLGIHFMQPRAPEPGRRVPPDGHAAEGHPAEIHGPVDHDIKTKARSGAKTQYPDGPFPAVAVGEKFNAENL